MQNINPDTKNNGKLLILDLDENLIFSSEKKLEYKEDFMIDEYYVYKRPFVDEFLEYAKKDFNISVWSSGSDDYVQEVIKNIFPKDYSLIFAWGRSRCTHKYDPDTANRYPVKKLFKVKKLGFKIENILIIDDTHSKAEDNYGNAVFTTPFEGNKDDKELLSLIQYLETIKDSNNYRSIEKRFWRNNIS
ncbi:HAD family hydrolase [Patescibacteria group bacterium]|nr:HAD family hydrolase [Patescibacteria group bacterium]